METKKRKKEGFEQRNLVIHSKKVHTRMTGFSRSVSSFPREFPKRAEEVRGRSSSATCPYDTLCIYAQVDIGKSVQVGRLGPVLETGGSSQLVGKSLET